MSGEQRPETLLLSFASQLRCYHRWIRGARVSISMSFAPSYPNRPPWISIAASEWTASRTWQGVPGPTCQIKAGNSFLRVGAFRRRAGIPHRAAYQFNQRDPSILTHALRARASLLRTGSITPRSFSASVICLVLIYPDHPRPTLTSDIHSERPTFILTAPTASTPLLERYGPSIKSILARESAQTA
jgi:hypothetical protein